jgi:hypothetical protein
METGPYRRICIFSESVSFQTPLIQEGFRDFVLAIMCHIVGLRHPKRPIARIIS